MKRALLVVALCAVAFPAAALKLTSTAPDGTVTTYEVGDSFAYQAFRGVLNPAYIVAGDVSVAQIVSFADKGGNVFTLGPAGEVYRNAVRLSTMSSTGAVQKMLAAKLVQIGTELYALGKSDQKWWRWDGTASVNKWVGVTADFDANILK